MHGSFNVNTAKRFYESFGLEAPEFSEGPLFNFSNTALSKPQEPKVAPKKPLSAEEQKLSRVKQVVEMSERNYNEDPSEENEDRFYRAQALLSHAEERYASLMDSMEESLQYSENFDTFDYARCQRPDGSFYGTKGKCRKGSSVGDKQQAAPKASVNHKDFASEGVMHPSMAKGMKVGEHVDFYGKGTGDKKSGIVVRNTGKLVMIKTDMNGKEGGGPVQQFKVSDKLPEKQQGSKPAGTADASLEKAKKKDLLNMRLRELMDKMDDAVTIAQQQRLSSAISDLQKRMSSGDY